MRHGLKISVAATRATRRSAVAAQDAANAAQKSADALMTGERAWLLVDAIAADPDFAKQGTPHFIFRVANFGKTPGFMIGAKAYVQISDEFDMPKEFGTAGL